tara:strand:+ start:2026 stop:2211 length:186 start_codon:yes stop_codon:yes gene_type:complete
MTVAEYNKKWEDIEILEKAYRDLSEFSGVSGELRDIINNLTYEMEGGEVSCSDYVEPTQTK